MTSVQRAWLAHLRLPSGVLGGTRGFLLVFVLLSGGPGMLPGLVLASREPLGLRLAAGLGLLALQAWYVWGYRRRHLPSLGLIFEAPVLSLVAVASGGPESALPLLYPSLMFRVFHSSALGQMATGIAPRPEPVVDAHRQLQ
jgi:hypothetical protein